VADRSGKDSLYTDVGLEWACRSVEQTPRQSSFRVESSLFSQEPSIRVHSCLFLPLPVYPSTTRRVPSIYVGADFHSSGATNNRVSACLTTIFIVSVAINPNDKATTDFVAEGNPLVVVESRPTC
jgi:hypothetical protein